MATALFHLPLLQLPRFPLLLSLLILLRLCPLLVTSLVVKRDRPDFEAPCPERAGN
jgi:hypothetical protein